MQAESQMEHCPATEVSCHVTDATRPAITAMVHPIIAFYGSCHILHCVGTICRFWFGLQVTEALNAGDLRPPHIPFELMQQLAQSRAVLADLQATLNGASDDFDVGSAPSSKLFWTARLSASASAPRQEGTAASSSAPVEQPSGVMLDLSACRTCHQVSL